MTFEQYIVEKGYISELGLWHAREYRKRSILVVKQEFRTIPNCLLLIASSNEPAMVAMLNNHANKREYCDTTSFIKSDSLFKVMSPDEMLDTRSVILAIDPKVRKITLGTCSVNENQIIKAKTLISQHYSNFSIDTVKILEVPMLRWVKSAYAFDNKLYQPTELQVPVDEVLKTVFRIAVEKRASDISFESFDDGTYVKLFIDQEWSTFTNYKFTANELQDEIKELDNRLMTMCGVATNALSEKVIDAALPDLGYIKTHRGRMNRIKSNYGITTNIRVLPNKPSFVDLTTLGYTKMAGDFVRFLTKPRKGLVLFVGETNSGKNTSVFALLSELIKRFNLKIISLENPIEYLVPKVNQTEASTSEEYKEMARAVVRQSPNVFYISEIRDDTTMDSALTLSNQGKFSISTLHVSHAYQVFNRAEDIIGKDVSNKMTAELLGVINQKLMPKACPECIKQIPMAKIEDDEIRSILKNYSYNGPVYINTGKTDNGDTCPYCEGQGTRNLVPIAEFINFDDALKRKLRRCADLPAKEELLQDKMRAEDNTLADDALRQMFNGNLNIDTILSKSVLTSEYIV